MLIGQRRVATIAVGLKMYFGYEQTVAWCERVKEISLAHRSVETGAVELLVLPSYPVLARTLELFAGTNVGLGAQNLHWEDTGPFTGEVSGAMLAEMGCKYVEVGHAERRRDFGEAETVVAAKTRAALRNGLVPVVCVGEPDRQPTNRSLPYCLDQLESALGQSEGTTESRVIVAYEPVWAIGAREPAPPDHIRAMCEGLRVYLNDLPAFDSTIIYGGTAGPGLLGDLGDSLDGLALGRSAHDPNALELVLSEIDDSAA